MTNLVNILKYCPEGTKLYSPIFGEVIFKKISSSNDIFCRVTKGNGDITTVAFTCLGRYYCDFLNSECMLFPSKDQRNWDTFQAPFKRGDIIMFHNKSAVFMADTMRDKGVHAIAWLSEKFKLDVPIFPGFALVPASEDMKRKFFDAMDKAGYEWDGETLKKKEYQFKPFEKVLVRDGEYMKWRCALYSHFEPRGIYHHVTISCAYIMCIPFKGNEHLIGTADNP
jgi:hypothetical protein